MNKLGKPLTTKLVHVLEQLLWAEFKIPTSDCFLLLYSQQFNMLGDPLRRRLMNSE